MMPEQLEEEMCCALRLCCGGHGDRKAKAALSNKLQNNAGLPKVEADKAADWIQDTFDLAMKGWLTQLYKEAASMAREYPYNPD